MTQRASAGSINASANEASVAFARASEAAAFLGVSTGMVHKMIGKGEMPSRRYGRAVRIPWAWLKSEAGE